MEITQEWKGTNLIYNRCNMEWMMTSKEQKSYHWYQCSMKSQWSTEGRKAKDRNQSNIQLMQHGMNNNIKGSNITPLVLNPFTLVLFFLIHFSLFPMFKYSFVKKDLSLQEDVPILQFILFFFRHSCLPLSGSTRL